jgi:hypothetical protein
MIVQGVWYGGYNYSHGDITADLERWPSLAAAKRDLEDRCYRGAFVPQDFHYVNREPDTTLTPTVGASETYIDLYGGTEDDPTGSEMWGRIKFGPRGGVVVEYT